MIYNHSPCNFKGISNWALSASCIINRYKCIHKKLMILYLLSVTKCK